MTAEPAVLPVVAPADDVPGPPQGQWTYEAYAAIPDDGKRYEIIDGVLYMTPSPNTGHQNSTSWILVYLKLHVESRGLGKVFVAPFDVELAPKLVVQPDVLVILNEHLDVLTPSHVVGTPDLVIEVSSPSTATYDRRRKMDAYARAGVREYWIADPPSQTVERLYLENGQYVSAGVFQGAALLPSRVLPDFPVRVEQFFA
jgi:Uma2 family endonuclease